MTPNGGGDCAGDPAKGACPVGDGACWRPVLCFAKGFVDVRFSAVAPVALAIPVAAGGSIDCLNGFVEVCCGCSGSAIVGICICCCCCEKSGTPFCGIDDSVLCALNGCGV